VDAPEPSPVTQPPARPRGRARALLRRHAAAGLFALALLAGLGVRARVGYGWTFQGSDSWAYTGAAMELWQHHRFAIRSAPWLRASPREVPPPAYGRLPVYPLLLAAAVRPVGDCYDCFPGPAKALQWLLDLGTCVLVFLIARRLGGRWAAWPAFGLALLHPGLILYSNAILTETTATFLVTLTVALVVCSLDPGLPARRARWMLLLAGAAGALATLTRIDCVLVLVCLAVPFFWPHPGVKRRVALLGLGVFALCYSPWPLRNLAAVGAPHAFGGACDVRGREMQHTAFFGWFATWLEREDQTTGTLYCLLRPGCRDTIASYPLEAFDSPAERTRLAQLFNLRAARGLGPETDAGFRALTRERVRRHPLRSFVTLPLTRAYQQWTSRADQPLRATAPHAPWPAVTAVVGSHLREVGIALAGLALAGLVALLLRRGPPRALGLLLASVILARSAAFALIGFVDARYLLEVIPCVAALAGAAIGLAVAAVARLRRAGASP
jgi:hypothetical protein